MKKWKCLGSDDCYMEHQCVIEMDDTLEPERCVMAGAADWELVVAPVNTAQQELKAEIAAIVERLQRAYAMRESPDVLDCISELRQLSAV